MIRWHHKFSPAHSGAIFLLRSCTLHFTKLVLPSWVGRQRSVRQGDCPPRTTANCFWKEGYINVIDFHFSQRLCISSPSSSSSDAESYSDSCSAVSTLSLLMLVLRGAVSDTAGPGILSPIGKSSGTCQRESSGGMLCVFLLDCKLPYCLAVFLGPPPHYGFITFRHLIRRQLPHFRDIT